MFYVYILYSRSINRYYIGHTDNVQRRIAEHNNPKRLNKYTARVSDWELAIAISAGRTRSEAINIERYIKKQRSRKYIERIISLKTKEDELAQLDRVPTSRD